MPRQMQPPRLHLYRRTGRPSVWIILDSGKQISTRFLEKDRNRAVQSLVRYLKTRPQFEYDPTLQSEELTGSIYWVTAWRPGFPVKVGYSSRGCDARVGELQTGCPYELYVYAEGAGSETIEYNILRRFDYLRLKGEWLRRSPELMDYIHLHFRKTQAVRPTARHGLGPFNVGVLDQFSSENHDNKGTS